ncbi:cytochrome d ubiquinol oxidase subunit II [Mycobacterium tuberculosis]|uniref:cytochrome d ubiquinol oxidase subunit II n=1 Tax=Mycobacterium tuberculosis TaxID=1773 RepID=UPI0004B8E701|nr:cytochrome d ubiquinol oxidase subunit II [Mycobacterium tuberculosis]
MVLQELWFGVIAALFLGFFILEGFDFGVGMLMAPFAHVGMGDPETHRRTALNTIGPVWDGNEVWLITAGAAIFAAFPGWYATVFSALYLPLLAILFGMILRAVAIEWRGKIDDPKWRTGADFGIAAGSWLPALLWGVAFAILVRGLPFLAEGRISGVTLQGIRDLQQEYQQRFGPNDYRPNLFVTYWSFRMMIGLMAIPVLFALIALWLTHGGQIPNQRWFSWLALLTMPAPFLANSAGWVFTEMGRQPWVVVPNPTGDQLVRLTVKAGVSDHSATVVATSLLMFTLVYAVLAVIWCWLLKRYIVEGPLEHDAEPAAHGAPRDDEVAPLSFAY